MIEAIIAGVEDTEILSELAQRRLKNKKMDSHRALKGVIGHHQKLILKTQLHHIDFFTDFITNKVKRLDEEKRILPFTRT